MEYKVAISPKAFGDLEEIRAYIASENPSAANRFVQRLVEQAESLNRFPERGFSLRNRVNSRFIVHRSYLIVYRTNKDRQRVRVLRFYHAARDIGRLKLGDTGI